MAGSIAFNYHCLSPVNTNAGTYILINPGSE